MQLHKIYVRHKRVKPGGRLSIPFIKNAVTASLRLEDVNVPCEVSVLVTDDVGIRKINREFRGIDEATDVLSFPMHDLTPGKFAVADAAVDPDTGLLLLGDIIISAERLAAQARGFGHSLVRETTYLTVHSSLHLLGYDHIDEAEGKQLMREREEEILRYLFP